MYSLLRQPPKVHLVVIPTLPHNRLYKTINKRIKKYTVLSDDPKFKAKERFTGVDIHEAMELCTTERLFVFTSDLKYKHLADVIHITYLWEDPEWELKHYVNYGSCVLATYDKKY